mmetsp:Transcript_43061/g.68212  ORF Transcript_43061/g.68212 Transcript_43061/m.68212 type:complete len:109 (+) Transcript_43061:63-389(+)
MAEKHVRKCSLKHKAAPWNHAEDAIALSLNGQDGVAAVPLVALATGPERGISNRNRAKVVKDVIWTSPWLSLALHLIATAKIVFGMPGRSGLPARSLVTVGSRRANGM